MTSETKSDGLPAKKLSLLYILDILRRHSDPEHPLSQQQILMLLQEEYGMELDRKAVKRNLMNLLDAGYPLGYKPWDRRSTTKADKVEKVYGSWYYEHEFSPTELSAIIDSLLFSHLPQKQVRQMIAKLEKLQSEFYHNPATSVENIPNESWFNESDKSTANEMFLHLELLNEAIEERKMVRFFYLQHGPDKKATPRIRSGERRPHIYKVSPYAVVATNGRFYLIANTDGHHDISHYRIDRITQLNKLDTVSRAKSTVEGLNRGKLNLPRHLFEHVNMFAGEARECRFRADLVLMDAIIDSFGRQIKVDEVTSESAVITLKVNQRALLHWALQFGAGVKVLSPESLVIAMREATSLMAESYEHEEPEYYGEEE